VISRPTRTLVLGLGNPILADDAVGLLVVREAARLCAGLATVEIREASLAGLELLEIASGFERLVIVDAIKTSARRPGSVSWLAPHGLPMPERLVAAHEIDLPTALALGQLLGIPVPTEVAILAIEIEENRTFGLSLTPAVAAAIPVAISLLLPLLRGGALPFDEAFRPESERCV